MNNLIHDIEQLKEIQNAVGQFSASTIKSYIQDMIDEKQRKLTDFEIQDMSYEQYEAYLAGRGFND
jgi:hypothetical protein